MDALAAAYKQVRDATVCNTAVTTTERIGVLELVKAEILTAACAAVDDALAEERR